MYNIIIIIRKNY